jgi:hypothetical protein
MTCSSSLPCTLPARSTPTQLDVCARCTRGTTATVRPARNGRRCGQRTFLRAAVAQASGERAVESAVAEEFEPASTSAGPSHALFRAQYPRAHRWGAMAARHAAASKGHASLVSILRAMR